MKFYDKDLTKKYEEIRSIIAILIIFIISFCLGCFVMDLENRKEIDKLHNIIDIQQIEIEKQYTELESFKDAQYMKKYLKGE